MMLSRSGAMLALAYGFGVWISAFAVLYAVQGLGCALRWDQVDAGPISVLRAVLFAIWCAHLAALLWGWHRCRQAMARVSSGATERFLWQASAALIVAAGIALVWLGAALPLRSIC